MASQALVLKQGVHIRLMQSRDLPGMHTSIFAIAIATVILPTLSGQRARADDPAFASTLSWAIRSVLLIAIPATAALAVLAEPLLTTLFAHPEGYPAFRRS